MINRTYDQMDIYNQGIVKGLQELFHYSLEEAVGYVNKYAEPLHCLDQYDSPVQRAESLHNIMKKGVTPEQWIEHINKFEKNP